jgi:SET family sugar efflux transporter-like MFS transporter
MRQLSVHIRVILRHRDFVILLGCNVLLGLAYSFVGPFFSLFGTDAVGMTPFGFGIFMAITAVSAIGVSTVLARWSDTRFSRRSILLAGSGSGALGYIGYAFVRDPVGLTLVGSLVLSISSITFSQLFARARELVARSDIPPQDTPLYMNVFRLFFALSWTIGPAAAAWVNIRFSFEGTFLVAAFFFVILFFVVRRFVPSTPPSLTTAQAARATPLRQTLMRRDVLAHYAGFALVLMAGSMCMYNLPQMVMHTLGGTEHDVGIIYSLAPFFELPFMYLVGVAATRGDHARLIRLSVLLAVVYYGLLGLVRAPWQIYPLQILSAAITAVTQGIAITFFQNFLPDQVGTATNLYSTAQRVGSTIGPLVFGSLLAAGGSRVVFFTAMGLCVVAYALLWWWRPRIHDPARSAAGPERGPGKAPC